MRRSRKQRRRARVLTCEVCGENRRQHLTIPRTGRILCRLPARCVRRYRACLWLPRWGWLFRALRLRDDL